MCKTWEQNFYKINKEERARERTIQNLRPHTCRIPNTFKSFLKLQLLKYMAYLTEHRIILCFLFNLFYNIQFSSLKYYKWQVIITSQLKYYT